MRQQKGPVMSVQQKIAMLSKIERDFLKPKGLNWNDDIRSIAKSSDMFKIALKDIDTIRGETKPSKPSIMKGATAKPSTAKPRARK